jgi:hypothetical protein
MLWPLSIANFDFLSDCQMKDKGRVSVVRHMAILIYVDWLPTGQRFVESPFSLEARISISAVS